jgi:PAS domain-containing protein
MEEIIKVLPYLWDHFGSWAILILVTFIELRWKPLRQLYKGIAALEQSNRNYESVQKELGDLKTLLNHELKRNGGQSLKDSLTRTEELVRRLAAQAHVGMDLHPYGIFMCDFNGRFFYVNRTLANKLQSTKEELKDMGWHNFLATDEDYADRLTEYLKDKRDISSELKFVSKSKEVVSCSVIATVLDSSDGYMGYIIFQA